MDFYALWKLTIVDFKKKKGVETHRRETVLLFCTLRALLSALGCKLQPTYWIQYSNQWWREDWNMGTDRAGLSEEYEMQELLMHVMGVCCTDTSHLYEGILCPVGLKWVKENMRLPNSSIRLIPITIPAFFINSAWMETNRWRREISSMLGTLHP